MSAILIYFPKNMGLESAILKKDEQAELAIQEMKNIAKEVEENLNNPNPNSEIKNSVKINIEQP